MRRPPLTPQGQIERRRALLRVAGLVGIARAGPAGGALSGLTQPIAVSSVAALPFGVWAQRVEVDHLSLRREDGHLLLDYGLRLELSRVVQEALERGVPIHFTAQATLREARWYWRDRRIHREQRSWRLAYQPLTASWRVGTGGLYPQLKTLEDALALMSRVAGWRVADAELLAQLPPTSRHYIEFEFRLDTSQLPGPMQIGLTAQDDWTVALERRLPLPPP